MRVIPAHPGCIEGEVGSSNVMRVKGLRQLGRFPGPRSAGQNWSAACAKNNGGSTITAYLSPGPDSAPARSGSRAVHQSGVELDEAGASPGLL